MNKPQVQAPPADDGELKSSYEKIYGRPLTAQQEAEMSFNLVRYIELLIVLDQQHKDWLEEQAKAASVDNDI
jgi:hypothetical protein